MMTNTRNDRPQDRLIFALDIGSGGMEEILSWVEGLQEHVGLFKVGKEAFTIYGPALIHKIHERGARVFLDLKYHDIPNTVGRAAEGAVGLGVAMFNVHAAGGRSMMAAAVAAANQAVERLRVPAPVLIAVTVLTSLGDEDLQEIGINMTTMEAVVNFARMAQDAGLAGVVASPREIGAIRKACGEDFVIVTPGIRGRDTVTGDDQKRTLSPEEAILAGADYLVVGRPIRMATNPASEADRFVEAIARGLQARGSL
ncbi:MAG: Orotidine 5-phosphate decarboxylase [Thermodesulfobacteriota bacterium]|nr:Orotidine 5-phosphate decarboxylase [Thermodesulfobacteriota bacterium]